MHCNFADMRFILPGQNSGVNKASGFDNSKRKSGSHLPKRLAYVRGMNILVIGSRLKIAKWLWLESYKQEKDLHNYIDKTLVDQLHSIILTLYCMEKEKGMKRESIFCYMSAPSLVLAWTTLKTVCLNVIATGSEGKRQSESTSL